MFLFSNNRLITRKFLSSQQVRAGQLVWFYKWRKKQRGAECLNLSPSVLLQRVSFWEKDNVTIVLCSSLGEETNGLDGYPWWMKISLETSSQRSSCHFQDFWWVALECCPVWSWWKSVTVCVLAGNEAPSLLEKRGRSRQVSLSHLHWKLQQTPDRIRTSAHGWLSGTVFKLTWALSAWCPNAAPERK